MKKSEANTQLEELFTFSMKPETVTEIRQIIAKQMVQFLSTFRKVVEFWDFNSSIFKTNSQVLYASLDFLLEQYCNPISNLTLSFCEEFGKIFGKEEKKKEELENIFKLCKDLQILVEQLLIQIYNPSLKIDQDFKMELSNIGRDTNEILNLLLVKINKFKSLLMQEKNLVAMLEMNIPKRGSIETLSSGTSSSEEELSKKKIHFSGSSNYSGNDSNHSERTILEEDDNEETVSDEEEEYRKRSLYQIDNMLKLMNKDTNNSFKKRLNALPPVNNWPTVENSPYKEWKQFLDQANRACLISIYNSSKYEFELTKGKVQHGKWASEPPAKIPVHSIGRFGTFSKNKFGSTKGYAKYTAIIKGVAIELLFSWNSSPLFADKAEYVVAKPFRCEREGVMKKHAEIIFRIFNVEKEN